MRCALVITLALSLAQPAISIASPNKPTNDSTAFHKFDLYSDRLSSVNVANHWNMGVFPGSLNSDALLVVRSATDTMALFKSKPFDGIDFNCGCQGYPSYVDLSVTPPQYATSIGLLSMARGVFNGTGNFNDYNATALRLRWTFADGDTAAQTVRVGKHVRNWRSGFVDCNCACGPQPYYVTPPDSLGAVLYTGPLSPPWPPGDAYYDAVELPLPADSRSKKIAALRVAVVDHVDYCGTINFSSEHFLYGCSIWPKFAVRNAQGDPVARQSQTTGHHHGGYLFGNEVVGWRRETDQTGCKITSLAVAYTYAGFGCSVDSINAFLQRSQGYKPSQVCRILSVAPDGSSVTFTPLTQDDTRLHNGDTFLVEHGIRANPLATYQVTSPGHASRFARHNNLIVPSAGDSGRVYWNSIPAIADKYTHPGLRSVYVPATPQAAAIVESLLVRDIAVQLNVGPKGGHWVVADGMTSSFRPDGSARGTYSIKDPYDPRNYTKLIEGQYGNTFTEARYVVPTGLPLLSSTAAVTSDPAGLSILADGAQRVEIVDPLGRHMMRDASTGDGVYDITDATIEDVAGEDDNGGGLDEAPSGYDIEIPTGIDGHYIVYVSSSVGLSFSVSGYDGTGVFATDIVVDTTAAGSIYDVTYSSSGQSVSIGYAGTLGVGTVPIGHAELRARHSPVSGPVEFLVVGGLQVADVIDIFDVGGRRVGSVQVGSGLGTQMVVWDWRLAGCQPGAFFARLRSGTAGVVRFVVLR